MDALIDLLMLLVFHWRLGLSVLGSIVMAVFLASALPWFSGAFGIALVIGSVGAGLLWEGAADGNRARRMGAKNEDRRNG
jgi:hypothetical protein